MPDFAAVTAVLSSLKHATDVAKLIKDSGATLAAAEQKLKLAELIEALADAKLGMADLKGEIETRDSEIRALKSALSVKPTLSHREPFYFKEGDATPFCPRCWEVDSKAIHVAPEEWDGKRGFYVRRCPECDASYKTRESSGSVGAILV